MKIQSTVWGDPGIARTLHRRNYATPDRGESMIKLLLVGAYLLIVSSLALSFPEKFTANMVTVAIGVPVCLWFVGILLSLEEQPSIPQRENSKDSEGTAQDPTQDLTI